jgi:hypothetical protein
MKDDRHRPDRFVKMQGSESLPDAFDRALENMKGRPDVVGTKAATIRTVPTLAIGGSQLYVVQTYREQEEGGRSRDTIFLECYGSDGQHRLALPTAVADAIARQRDALATKTRKKAARRVADDRKARGEQPAFLRTREG